MQDFKHALRNALITQFKIDRGSLDDGIGLFSGGLLDSLSVMDLVCFVESKIGQAVPPADITLENFDSIEKIAAFVRTLTNEGLNT